MKKFWKTRDLIERTPNYSKKDLEEYEKDYLKRIENPARAKKKAKVGKKKKQDQLIRTLSSKDYIMLEAHRQEDFQMMLKFGTMEGMEIIEKLFDCELIERLDREPTFDEKEKQLKFMDSPAYKQKEKRVKQLMTDETEIRFYEYAQKLGIKTKFDLFDLTDKGRKILTKKRKELESVWAELKASYEKGNKQIFREKLDQNKSMFPLFMVMGLVNGAMMGVMMGKMDMNFAMYMQGMNEIYDMGFTDGGGVIEGGDVADGGDVGGDSSSGGEGGFMDGGANVGF